MCKAIFSVKCTNENDPNDDDYCTEFNSVDLMLINETSQFMEAIMVNRSYSYITQNSSDEYHVTVSPLHVDDQGKEIAGETVMNKGDYCIVMTNNDALSQATDYPYVSVQKSKLQNLSPNDICQMSYCEYHFYIYCNINKVCELQMGFSDVTFLPSRASFYTTFPKKLL